MMMVIIYVPPPLPAPSLQGRTAVLPVPTLGDACRPPVPGRPRWFLLLSLSFLDSERCEDGDGLVFISEATVQGLTRSRCQDSFALKKKKKGMTSSAHFQGFRPMENSTVGAAAVQTGSSLVPRLAADLLSRAQFAGFLPEPALHSSGSPPRPMPCGAPAPGCGDAPAALPFRGLL